jgi:hypothetical protein
LLSAPDLLLEHDLFAKPVSIFPDRAFLVEQDLFGKPLFTFPDHCIFGLA